MLSCVLLNNLRASHPMPLQPLTAVKHATTALVLLLVVLAGVEIWLRTRPMPSVQIVASTASVIDQPLLMPSAVCHHELRRLQKTTVSPGQGVEPVRFRVNSLGCRGPDVATPAAPGLYRILILGDDSVCGSGVAEEETIAARLKQFLSKSTTAEIEVINGGVPGYCPLLSSLKFEHELARLKPDLVILHLDMTDIGDDSRYRSLVLHDGDHAICSHASFRLQAKSASMLMQLTKQSATACWFVAQTRRHAPELLSVATTAEQSSSGLTWITDHPPDLRLQIRHALDPIKNLQASVANAGGQLLVTTSPVLWQVVSADEAPDLSRRYGVSGATPYASLFPFEVLASFCRAGSIHFCDTSVAFRNENAAKLFSKDTVVLSRIGMALYAREIARCLLADPPSQWSR